MKSRTQNPMIVDMHGAPMKRATSLVSYDAADRNSQELSLFNPNMGSADSDYIQHRNTIVSRTRHLVQNSGWASSAVTRHLDSVIGIGFRPSVKPDYHALGLSKDWARQFAKEVEGRWRMFAEDPYCYIDVQRRKNFTDILRVAYREWLIAGEAIAVGLWLPGKPHGRCATTIQMMDSDLLSNPYDVPDSETMRGGVELDEYGGAIAYHFRQAHPAEFGMHSNFNAWTWERVSRETPWGRRRVIHAYEEHRPNQTRGISKFAPVVERFKMLDKYDKTELQAALLNAVLAAVIESPMDGELMLDAMEDKTLDGYQKLRSEYHDEKRLHLNGTRVSTLFPGEELKLQAPTRPSTAFVEFERACLRNIAAAMGLTYEQMTADWSQVNYSSARAAMMEIWKTLGSDRTIFANQFATHIFLLWLEEEINAGKIVLPEGAPSFYEAPGAYAKIKWLGTGRGYVDPEKEAKAANMRINTRISTLEDECAEQGKDHEEVLEQMAEELELMKKLGLPFPDWAAAQPTVNQYAGAEVE